MIRPVATLTFLLALGAAAYAAEAEKPVERPDAQKAEDKHPGPPVVEFDDMIINLSEPPDKRTRNFIKLRMALEAAKPRIIDTFQVYLRELRPEDLQGSVGVVRLKEELLQRVNAAVAPIEVRAVLFKDFLVQ